MKYCKKCGWKFSWEPKKVDGKLVWVPIGADPRNKDYGLDHRKFCVPDPKYMERREGYINRAKSKNEDQLQIGENEIIK